jgi:hypothetical protein
MTKTTINAGSADTPTQIKPLAYIDQSGVGTGPFVPINSIADGTGNAYTTSNRLPVDAGTNLNTSALALETGGNLAAVATATGAQTDTAYVSGSGGIIALLKGIFGKLSGTLAVTGTFWQTTQPVSAAALPLPSGASTAALQPAINGDGGSMAHVTNFPATQPVSAAALPLPAGAATSALQSSIVTALGSPLQAGGSVAVTALPALPAGAATIGSIANTSFGVTQATAANLNMTEANSAAILAKLIAAPATAANQASEITALAQLHTDLVAATPAGSNIIGKVGIDQTTPGTTNGVQVNNTVAVNETYTNIAASAAPVSIAQAATLIVAARTGRKEVTLILEAAVALRIGGSGVGAATNGALLQGIAGEAITLSGGAAVYGYAPAGTAIVSALEVF